jgi:hypothetical protein
MNLSFKGIKLTIDPGVWMEHGAWGMGHRASAGTLGDFGMRIADLAFN